MDKNSIKFQLLKQSFLREATEDSILKKIGKLMVEIIYNRTKKGIGLDPSNLKKQKKFDKLSDSYKEYRKRNPPTGDGSGINKSNLTYTGEMLDSMTFKIKGTSKGKNIHLLFLGKDNKAKANFVQDKRPFFGFTTSEENQIKEELKQLIYDRLNVPKKKRK